MFYTIMVPVIAVLSIPYIFKKPSNNRNWSSDQQILPYAEIDGPLITMRNIRDFKYTSENNYTPHYYDKTFNIDDIKTVYYNITPFHKVKSAHTFLSFEFEGGNFISISVEIRKRVGQKFSAFKGLIRGYEIMYVVADERDVIGLRALHRKDSVYVYPLVLKVSTMKRLFMNIVKKINSLKEKPEFYNTITNACNTSIARHLMNGSSTNKRMPFDIRVVFPADSDALAQKLKIIDDSLPIKKLREKYLVNSRVEKYANDSDFSIKIRRPLEENL